MHYHVYDLLERETEGEHHSLGFIGDGSLQLVVVGEQVLQQHPLVQTAVRSCNLYVSINFLITIQLEYVMSEKSTYQLELETNLRKDIHNHGKGSY